jgi:hypothetical protein
MRSDVGCHAGARGQCHFSTLAEGNYAGTAALLTAVDMQLHPGQKPLLSIP